MISIFVTIWLTLSLVSVALARIGYTGKSFPWVPALLVYLVIGPLAIIVLLWRRIAFSWRLKRALKKFTGKEK